MGKVILCPSRNQVFFEGTELDLRQQLYEVLKDPRHTHHLVLVEILHSGAAFLDGNVGRRGLQAVLDRASAWVRKQRLYDGLPRSCGTRSRTGATVLKFGKHAGKRIDEVPVDYLAGLLKYDGLWQQTRKSMEAWLDLLRREPNLALMPFGKHWGQQLGELPNSYLDWLLAGVDMDGEVLPGLVAREYQHRFRKERVQRRESWKTVWFTLDVTLEDAVFDFLPGVDDYEPFESRGFIPSEGFMGHPRKPSAWMLTRSREQVQADEEVLNQVWHHGGGQRLLWPLGLRLPPTPVLYARQDRKRVYWAVLKADLYDADGEVLIAKGSPVIKGQDKDVRPTDPARLRCWDDALEAIDQVAGAPDLDELEWRVARARLLAEFLAESENWPESLDTMLEEVEAAYLRRKDTLERREECFTDTQFLTVVEDEGGDGGEEGRHSGRRRSLGSRVVQRIAADLQEARVQETVRRMRGARTLDDLADIGLWVSIHSQDFSEASLTRLRGWYSLFRAEITAAKLAELVGKYDGQVVTSGA